MRLTCPNCGARYEVDPSMIPAAGRDVQCSNCSTTWFQPGPRTPNVTAPPPPEPTAPPTPEPHTRRELDPDVADILREEAAREEQLRRRDAEPSVVETQSEMSLEGSIDGARARDRSGDDLPDGSEPDTDAIAAAAVAGLAAARPSRVPEPAPELEPEPTPEPAPEPDAPRSELLPDIEEINSTLRATGDRKAGAADATDADNIDDGRQRRRQVRIGFFGVVFVAVAAWALYTQAPLVIANVPQSEPYVQRYVAYVDDVRTRLDRFARDIAAGN